MRLPADSAARHLAAIVESSVDAILSKDTGGTITFWNRAAERLFGYTADEAIGHPAGLIVPKDQRAQEERLIERVRRGETVEHFETIRCRKDGQPIPVAISASPILDDEGTVVGVSQFVRDISERRRAESALSNVEAQRADLQRRLLTLVDASGSLVGTPDLQSVISATLRIAAELVPADGYAVWRFNTTASNWTLVAGSGMTTTFLSRTREASEGEIAAGALTFTEPLVITDAHLVPEVSMRAEAYVREGVRSMLAIPLTVGGVRSATLVFYYRERRVFTDVDVQAARALGNLASGAMTTAELYEEQRVRQRQAQLLARASTTLAGSLDYRETLAVLAGLIVPEMADWCAIDLVNEGAGLDRIGLAHVEPLNCSPTAPDEHGVDAVLEPTFMRVPLQTREGVVGAFSFACAHGVRQFTPADLEFAEQLATRAAIAVENARAYEEARRANRVKDDFLATLSHELRTPLNAILGYARMLQTQSIPPERQAHALKVIDRNATALAQIVADVLDVSRIVAGKLRLNVDEVDVTRLVVEAIDSVAPASQDKGVALHVEPPASPLMIRGDGDRLQQVMWNLLSNAIKFTPAGGRVDVMVSGREDGAATVQVRDTGIGIGPAFLEHIFEPFRQADSGPRREFGGLGLGLAIARRIVDMHGGTIEVESGGDGSGSEFRVTLPQNPPDLSN